jgi:hypothetical protein
MPAFTQGIVNFANSPSTLISYRSLYSSETGLISGSDWYYFALLTSSSGAPGTFVFTGIYATNRANTPGRFVNNGVTVPNWPAGTRLFFQVAGWHSSAGPTFNPNWQFGASPGPFALSAIGSGVAGGTDSWTPARPFPPLPIFGGTGITSGFQICCTMDLQLLRSDFSQWDFRIIGPGGIQAILEANTNLADPSSWIMLQNLRLPSDGFYGFIYFKDWERMNYPTRFYRVRSP